VGAHHVERIKELARQGFYNGVIFHRVIDGFMAQTGDPTGTGQGGSKLPDLKAEFNDAPHVRGTVSMARNEPNSANSQFFIVFYPRFALDHKYTNFGRVISGMDTSTRSSAANRRQSDQDRPGLDRGRQQAAAGRRRARCRAGDHGRHAEPLAVQLIRRLGRCASISSISSCRPNG
jgi:cyclophilin family peptidyl-prolyl cis-trans isomerase